MKNNVKKSANRKHTIQYDNWGYVFIAPFFVIYIIFSLIPLLTTFIFSLFEYYRVGLLTVGPTFIGLENFKAIFTAGDSLGKYFLNTLIMWVMGFVPQIIISLLLAVWFTNTELNLKGQGFFKTVIYMPNLIMAATFAMLFFTLFSPNGPVNGMIRSIVDNTNAAAIAAGTQKPMEPIRFFSSTAWTRTLVATMNFLMWYGNTTILLMAGVMGIDNSLFEAARIDGASPSQVFFKVTMPLLLPIFVYVFITSLIGGIQMFDVPQILTNAAGTPDRTTMTIIMKLNNHLQSKNYGPAGAISVLLFAVTGVLSGLVYKITMSKYQNKR
ncbi:MULTISPECIES: carbohydrate ABC transporter permease [unclassified Treponema]|uniref:carbohydrate ABC transporter permease n=1 Tax=unclassified Treponema TaxID=2638727 RepID=UPI0025E82E4C|nr:MULTISPECIES: sugar ABC transporter permease [unclassified Treponema]